MKDRISLKALLKKPGVIYAGGVGDAAGALLSVMFTKLVFSITDDTPSNS